MARTKKEPAACGATGSGTQSIGATRSTLGRIAHSKKQAAVNGKDVHGLEPKPWELCLEAALSYIVAYGWKVFPGLIVGKAKKSYEKGKNGDGSDNWRMTDDPEQVRRDFKKFHPKCVGVPTGIVNGIFDIEADTKKGHNVDGLANLKALEAKHGKLPATLMAESPSGSVHRIYKHPGPGIKVKGSDGEIAPGVDIMGDGNIHRASKRAHRWCLSLAQQSANRRCTAVVARSCLRRRQQRR